MSKIMRIEIGVVMTTEVVTGTEEMTVRDGLKLMSGGRIHHLPILRKDPEGGQTLVGIVTERDLFRASSIFIGTTAEDRKDKATLDIHLKGFMTKSVHTLPPSAPVKSALRMMIDKKVGCVPIVEMGELKGIITVTDMLKLLDDLVV